MKQETNYSIRLVKAINEIKKMQRKEKIYKILSFRFFRKIIK